MVIFVIASRTPLRVSFFGGGTDLKDYYGLDYGCVLSTAIDKYFYIMANKRFDGKIQLNYRMTEIIDSVGEIFHPTIRESMKLTGINGGIELSSMADFPTFGTGLGSSSSFLVGVLNALYTYNKKEFDTEKLARDACKVEIDVLHEPIGKQDQYIAAYGGFRFIKFNKDDSVKVEAVKAKPETLKQLRENLLFFHTGISRTSSSVLTEQKQNIKDKVDFLNKIRDSAVKMRSELERNRLETFGKTLHESWLAKRELASNVSNEAIDHYYAAAVSAGATGGKVLGAGGGGFLMFYCEKEKQDKVRKALASLREVKFNFPVDGSRIIYADS